MFIAMNRFQVKLGSETEFERIWRERDTYLRDLPGFVEFHLLRGPKREDHTLYASHAIWNSREAFEDWTRSEAFRKAHQSAGAHRDLYLGGPNFEGFEVIQHVK
jgi:heme-degrading monooxygenase HmoA